MLLVHRSAGANVLMCAASLTCCSGAAVASESCFSYKAVAGDTLIGLGQQYLNHPSDWRVLARVNRIQQPKRIPQGTTLCLPVSVLKSTARNGVVLDVVGQATRFVNESPPAAAPLAKSRGETEPTRAAPNVAPTQVAKGDVITPGMSLRTSTNGYVTVQLADGSILKVQADTEARLDSSRQYEAAGFFASVWSVVRGRVESLVTHLTGGEPRYQIKTPQAVLGVRGTEFRVQTDARRTLNETLSGTVEVRQLSQGQLVSAGQGTIAAQGNPVAAPVPLPAAPDLSRVPDLQERPVVRVELPEVSGASNYRVQVAEDADFRRVRGEVTAERPVLRVVDLPDGAYYLRARVANAQGLEGLDAVKPFKLKARPEPPIPAGPAHKAKVRDTAATLTWSAHPDASVYRVQVAQDAAFAQLVLDRPDVRDTQLRVELAPGDYHWRLATTAAKQDRGPWGDAQVLLMRPPPPEPPPPVISASSLSFSLLAEPGQRFEFQSAPDATFSRVQSEIKSADSTVVIPKPAEGGRMYIRYRAIDADGFIGPYTRPQLIALPACVRDGAGHCIQTLDRFMTSKP
jgi:hypothetical protein